MKRCDCIHTEEKLDMTTSAGTPSDDAQVFLCVLRERGEDSEPSILTMQEFERLLAVRFPNHVADNYGASVFDYIAGNIQTAIVEEILALLESWAETLREASATPRFIKNTKPRDWEVALSHTQELISEVRQYRTRGVRGTPTGSVHLPTPEES